MQMLLFVSSWVRSVSLSGPNFRGGEKEELGGGEGFVRCCTISCQAVGEKTAKSADVFLTKGTLFQLVMQLQREKEPAISKAKHIGELPGNSMGFEVPAGLCLPAATIRALRAGGSPWESLVVLLGRPSLATAMPGECKAGFFLSFPCASKR